MKVLGIDTSGYANAIGVTDGGRILAGAVFPARTDSLQKIVLNIDSILKEAGCTLSEIGGFGVGLGPGSWTGIRIGVTVGKVLAFSTGKPVCGVSSLDILAHGVKEAGMTICPVVSSGTHSAVYAAFYKSEHGTAVRTGDYYVGDVAGLARFINEPTVFVGVGASLYRDEVMRSLGKGIEIKALESQPSGAIAALLASARLGCGESDDALALTPLYLKESTAKAFESRYRGASRG